MAEGVRRCSERNSSLPQIQRTEKGLTGNHTIARKGEAQSRPLYFSRIGVRIVKSGQFSVSGFQERFEVCFCAGGLHSHGSILQSYTRNTFLYRKLPADIPPNKGHQQKKLLLQTDRHCVRTQELCLEHPVRSARPQIAPAQWLHPSLLGAIQPASCPPRAPGWSISHHNLPQNTKVSDP